MEGKIGIIKENVKEAFSLVKGDVERLNSAFSELRAELGQLEDKTRSSLEGVDIRQSLVESNVPKIMESHGKSLQSILRLNKSLIAVNTRLASVNTQQKNIEKEHSKIHRQISRMNKNIYKKLAAMEKDIKKRALKARKKGKKK